ncbi:PGDYG domain-containing protein [Caballeronia sp. ATUFL_M2_KS44]|uniref:PGDYG domain-containing protein n=1 Tax=Caballeronia sp. ATUFL_M2_KS44 TaxID=2921767 RepID=UPI002028522C|nr:PGDYG domain-containing protein [Caballeronia sp. ATUFL_M2_KS44]
MSDELSMPDLTRDPDARRVIKRPVPVAVRFADSDGTCETLEGPVRFRAGDAIVTGTLNEQWPVSRDRFDETYERVSEGVYRKRPVVAYAVLLKSSVNVRVGAQSDVIEGQPGDWLIQYEKGEYGIVDAEVFARVYEEADEA